MTQYLGYDAQTLTHLQAGWTAREIEQQPSCWHKTQCVVDEHRDEIDAFLRQALAAKDTRIIFTGAGTSAFAGRALAPLLAKHINRPVEAIATTDLVSAPGQYFARDVPTLLVSFARSGNSPESVAALKVSSACLTQCFHLVLTCNPQGLLYQFCQTTQGAMALLMPPETDDRSLAMTSSFSSMLLAAILVFAGNEQYSKEIERFCNESANWFKELNLEVMNNTKNSQYQRVIYLGSGGLQGLAQESALKLLELTAGKIVAGFDTSLGFRHGPKSIVNSQTLIVIYVSNDPYTRQYDLDLLDEVRANNVAGKIIAIAAKTCPRLTAGDYLLVPGMTESTDLGLLFAYLMVAQSFAFHCSLAVQMTPDNPSPGGEINRVVQGVTIYPFIK